ncbi:hypothetical protein CEXT_21631 [Caerostris extrusa]|uniref:Uncharacterized protein n=1 Tax=Caerostris extrusa TaxID=172846 RepID=A0AAV4MCT9_CAEEX|nr:hypothetical protein CEXT_21631 [Caerostris extrusa]
MGGPPPPFAGGKGKCDIQLVPPVSWYFLDKAVIPFTHQSKNIVSTPWIKLVATAISSIQFRSEPVYHKGLPVTSRTEIVQPSSKSDLFYKQIQEAPLNYGSLNRRSCGKATD